MYPRQSGHYAYASQQPSQYPSQPAQYYETANYYQAAPQQPQPATQFAIGQSPVVPQFHVFTQPVAVYAQYPYQQQQQQQPPPQQIQVSPDQLYYNRPGPTGIVTSTPQPSQAKQITQLNQPPEQIVTQYQMIPPQQAQISQIPANQAQQQLLQQQPAYVQQTLKKKDKGVYPQSSMIITQLQSPSVYQQQQPAQMQMQMPIRQVSNLQSQSIPMKQQAQPMPQPKQSSQNTEMQLTSNIKQQFHFDPDEPPGCFDIIGRGNLPSVIFDSEVKFM